jgi:hypothetical protein
MYASFDGSAGNAEEEAYRPANSGRGKAWPDIAGDVRLYGAKAYATNQWSFSHWLNGDWYTHHALCH